MLLLVLGFHANVTLWVAPTGDPVEAGLVDAATGFLDPGTPLTGMLDEPFALEDDPETATAAGTA